MTRWGWTRGVAMALALSLGACGGADGGGGDTGVDLAGDSVQVDVVAEIQPDLPLDVPADLPPDTPLDVPADQVELTDATDAAGDTGTPDVPAPEQWVQPEDPVSGCVICHTDKQTLLALAPTEEEPETEGGGG